MTIASTPRKAGPFNGTSASVAYPFSFKVFAPTDLKVTAANAFAVESELVYGVDYTVTLNVNQDTSPGGVVTCTLSAGSVLTITGNLPYDQPLDLPSGGNFNPLALENELDRTVMQVQQLREITDRTLRLPVTTNGIGTDLPAPDPLKLIGWNADGNALVNLDPGDVSADILFAEMHYQTFTGDGTSTSFSLTYPPADLQSTIVSVDGLVMVPVVDYGISGSSVVFTTAPSNSADILVRYGRAATSAPAERETYRIIATDGQTAFTLAGGYPNGRNALAVYVNGLRMEPGGVDFTESSNTLVTFTTGLSAGDSVVFIVGAEAAGSGASSWSDITGKPTTFTPTAHTHAIDDVIGLSAALSGKQAALISGSNIKTINGVPLLGSGDLTVAGGASTAASVSFTPTGGVAATTVQAAIQELDSEKQATLVSGTSIKTINGSSLLGSGNIVVSGGGSVDADAIASALTSDATTKDWIWNSAIPGAVNAGDATSIYIQRNANYTGGTFAQVRSALYVETFTPTGTHNPFEWGLTSVVHSRSVVSGGGESAAPQNVGMNGTIFRTAGNAPIWAGNFAAYHLTDQYTSADGPMHGLEVNVGGNGTDDGESTIGLYVVPQLRAEVAGPGAFEGWTGILITGGGGSSARWRNGITNQAGSVFGYLDRGTHAVAIDLSTSTNSQSAIRIKANDWIALEATNAIKLRYNSSNGFIEFYNNSTRRGYINISGGADVDLASGGSTPSNMVTTDTSQTITALKTFTGGVDINGILCQNGMALGSAATIQWNSAMTSISAGSGFASLPANPVGFVKILIDGTERKVPFYV